MALLIDGYNLLHAAGIYGVGPARSSLERSRLTLLRFLAKHIDLAVERRAVVVFDAAGAPPGLPAQVVYCGLEVRFAKGYADADALLEELIRADSTPRQLTVVSSDHRVQRAARRRKCRTLDADVWYEAVRSAKRRNDSAPDESLTKHVDAETSHWLEQFVDPSPSAAAPESVAPFSDDYLKSVADELAAHQLPIQRRPRRK